MKFVKFLPHAGIIAVLAALMQFMDMTIPLMIAWVGFAAWACYFIAGCTPKGGAKVIGCWIAGVAASIVIIELGQRITWATGKPTLAFPLAVGIIAFFVILFEKVPALDLIPAWFVGAACFFAHNGANNPDLSLAGYKLTAPPILVTCAIAQVFGFVTVLLRTKYGAWAEGGAAEAPAEPAPDAAEEPA